MIVNYDSSIINKFGASLTDEVRVIIYDHHMFIVQATGVNPTKPFGVDLLTLFFKLDRFFILKA
jgi:hypothetical protein